MLPTRIFLIIWKTHLCKLHVELCIGIWKKWALCPEELGPPPLLGKNKIIYNENEAMVEKYLTNRNTLKTEKTWKFSERGLQMGLMNQGELTHRKMEIPWDSDVNLEHALCFWLQSTVRDLYVSVKCGCPC